MKKFLFLRTVLGSRDFLAASSLMGNGYHLHSLSRPGHRLIIAMNGINWGNCSYVITIETSCSKDAGTSDYISLRFGDSTNDVLIRPLNRRRVKWVDTMGQNVLDDVPRRPFQPCSVDEFQVDKPCVDTPICYLYLKLTGSDDWRPGFAQVRVQDEARFNSNYFYFRRCLPRHVWHGYDLCDREVTPFGIKHKRKVFH